MKLHVVLAMAFLGLALAGCGSPPSGTLTNAASGLRDVEGSTRAEFHAANNPLTAASGGVVTECAPPTAPQNLQCTPASSSLRVRLDSAPDPGTQAYHAFLMPITGPGKDLGAMTQNGTAYEVTYTEAADLTDEADRIEVRYGDFVLAESSARQPNNPIVVPDANTRVEVDGSYQGTDLTLKVSGLPGNATFMGRLYVEENGALVPKAEFPIAGNGETTFRSTQDINTYKQFHIHVTGSSINLIKLDI